MDTKNRFRLFSDMDQVFYFSASYGLEQGFLHIKFTKSPAVIVFCYGRNTYTYRISFQTEVFITVMPELSLCNCVKSSGMRMTGETNIAVLIFHKFKMRLKLCPVGIKVLFKA